MNESIGIALQVYFLGFVIALVMAFLIKIILFIIRRGNKPSTEKESAGSPGKEDKALGDISKSEEGDKDRKEGAA